MPRVFLPPEALLGERATLEGEAHRYLTRVLRLAAGDAVTVFDGHGLEIAAVVHSASARMTVLALGARRQVATGTRPVVLLQAIAKGERMDFIVQKTTELGVTRICPLVSARTVVQLAGSGGKLTRWRTIAQEAARQCGRADVPTIDEPGRFADVVAAADAGGARLIAWEDEKTLPLRQALSGDEPGALLLVGAEGGFTGEEVQAARAAGFTAVGLGPRILRSETAALVAVTLVQAAFGALD